MQKVFKVGLIGCGHIAETYFKGHKYFNNFRIIKCADIKHSAAKKCASLYKIKAVSVKDILKDKEIEIILNLTIPKAHFEVSKKALLNNKHVYTEKPMAIDVEHGKELVKIAKRKKLYIGNAPDTFLGGGNQKSKELIEKNQIGKINLGNIIFAYPGVQSYHPHPEPWFAKKEGGPVIDMGPYYLTALVNLLGPAKEVRGNFMKGVKYRVIGIGPKKGKKIKVNCPTTYLSTIVFENNTIIRFTLFKDACLTVCQSPLSFLMNNWKDGNLGTFLIGYKHGFYCIGCCWALMLTLFALGVMNIMWVMILTIFVLFEKLSYKNPLL